MDQQISEVGDYLIIQVKHFFVYNQALTKNISKISCTPTPTIPVILDEDIVVDKKFNRIATMKHSGNLARGHCTSFIKSTSSSWLHCNYGAVIPSKETALNNDISFFFFSTKISHENMKKTGGEL